MKFCSCSKCKMEMDRCTCPQCEFDNKASAKYCDCVQCIQICDNNVCKCLVCTGNVPVIEIENTWCQCSMCQQYDGDINHEVVDGHLCQCSECVSTNTSPGVSNTQVGGFRIKNGQSYEWVDNILDHEVVIV